MQRHLALGVLDGPMPTRNGKSCWIKDVSRALLTHWIVSASVEWLLGINITQDFIAVDRMAVDGVMVVEPPVHRAPKVTVNDGLMNTVEHILEVADLE